MAQQKRLRDYGVEPGILPAGPLNAITDVAGVRVGHVTLIAGDSVRTGVTAILPHEGNIFQQKVPAAIYIGNGFGKLMGYSQVEELGNLETPIVLTNTLSVPTAADAVIDFTLGHPENAGVRSVNPVVGETNDGVLNDIRSRHVRKEHVRQAIASAASGPVAEGNVGAGTGTICFGFKGGIGTASRRLPAPDGGYTVGVLVQANFGGVLQVDGLPAGKELRKKKTAEGSGDGSCMIVVATDAPADARNLKRMAKRAMLGLARTGGIASNGSGDYVIAFSVAEGLRVPYAPASPLLEQQVLDNSAMTALFLATIEATEEAILNSLFMAESMTGNGRTVEALPVEMVLEMMGRNGKK
ncbi:MAG: P1 family peptidase [Phaeodactylibacter sp.]|nr:P1 family peptidase [Phaeodactylibacter sp.]